MIEIGTPAPDFTLPTDDGTEVTLSSFRGKKVVLYFYPKDNTPGCTTQACDFRDTLPSFDGVNAVVLGVSADSVASHAGFRDRFKLNFPLLADDDHAVSEAYGVWKKHPVFGMTIERSTFLIDEQGTIRQMWRKVRPKGHAEMLVQLLGS